MFARLKALWAVLTAEEYVICHGGQVTSNGTVASIPSHLISGLCRVYNEAPDALKPHFKEIGQTCFMSLEEGMKYTMKVMANTLSDLDKTDSLKESIAPPAPAPKKRGRKK